MYSVVSRLFPICFRPASRPTTFYSISWATQCRSAAQLRAAWSRGNTRKLATYFSACLFITVLFLAISVHGCFYILTSFSGLVLKPFSLSVLVVLFPGFSAILRTHSSYPFRFFSVRVSSSTELFFNMMLFF